MLGSITFIGPCKNPIAFILKGTLKAPSNPSVMKKDQWISFRYVTGLVVNGGGTFDGNGVSSWKSVTPNSNPLPISIKFEFVKNAKINHITSLNSKNAHISIFGCDNLHFNKVRITAPGDSPNTDGFKIGTSKRISISKTAIGTGDDCIAILYGTSETNVLETPSYVQIKDITYKNIWGTSSTKLAAGLQCSKRFPCKNIVLNNINLVHLGPEGFALSLCSNVNGASYGRQTPASCL
ncbi:hypothetical protein Q3G72_027081 [Acer saccharum]|nr:hypothetical protein Q3G72_027081 [Acer saccharum]